MEFYHPLEVAEFIIMCSEAALTLPIRAVVPVPYGQAEADEVLSEYVNTEKVIEQKSSLRDKIRAIDTAIHLFMGCRKRGLSVERQAMMLSCQGQLYLQRFRLLKQKGDIDKAVTTSQEFTSLESRPYWNCPDQGWLPGFLYGNLGTCYHLRYIHAGSKKSDVDQAVKALKEAIKCDAPIDLKVYLLSSLGSAHLSRFDKTWSGDDINDAIKKFKRSLKLAPNEPAHLRDMCLNNLSLAFKLKFERSRDREHLEEAIRLSEEAIDNTTKHAENPTLLCTYAACLLRRYQTYQLGDVGILLYLARRIEKAVQELPRYDIRHVAFANTFIEIHITLLFEHHPLSLSPPDFTKFIEKWNDFLRSSTTNSTAQETLTVTLGLLSACRDGRGSPGCLKTFKKFVKNPTVSAAYRMDIARLGAQIEPEWKERSWFLRKAVELLPQTSPRTLRQADRQFMIGETSTKGTSLASTAASAILNTNQKDILQAIRVLEIGRGVLANKLLETRTEVLDLELFAPHGSALAREFIRLREKLDEPVEDPREATHPAASKDFKKLVKKIRRLKGFKNFLRPPDEKALKAAAGAGTIVLVNVSSFRCDAFIIQSGGIQLLPLKELSQKAIEQQTKDWEERQISLDSILGWLWDTVAGPVLDNLGFAERDGHNHKWPRLWWIPTGLLSRFPLHAAGWHGGSRSRTVIDRVISSYAASIQALLQARHLADRDYKRPKKRQDMALPLITHAPYASYIAELGLNFAPLRWVEREVEVIEPLLSSSCEERISCPDNNSVLSGLKTCSRFHFAGHGWTDVSDPSKSCLVLGSDLLTVNDISQAKLHDKPVYMAYLSACSTSENRATSLQDEGLHLVNAFQLSGIPHVVGSLWEIDDAVSVDAAQEIYLVMSEVDLLSNDIVALAVHRAARRLREQTCSRHLPPEYATRLGGNPRLWASYIHVGP